MAKLDCKAMKELYNFPKNKDTSPISISQKELADLTKKLELPDNKILLRSLRRIYHLSHGWLDDYDEFWIYSKSFRFSPEVYESLRKL